MARVWRSPSRFSLASCAALLLLALGGGCAMFRPSNVGDWSPDQAVLPRAEFHTPLVTVRNIRNCDYRTETDYTVQHYDKTYDLRDVDSVYFLVVPFPGSASMAHTMLSFGFANHDYLGVSAEVRKQKGQSYSPVTGLFNQFTLMYVLGDERDLIGLRTNYRLNDVYMYRCRATPQQAQRLLVDVLRRTNRLAEKPEFYNTLTNNCTSNIVLHVNRLAPHEVPLDYRMLLPGYSDRLAYDLGLLDTEASYEEAREQARITRQAYVYRDSPTFSVDIRR
jgi:hypothetical protein